MAIPKPPELRTQRFDSIWLGRDKIDDLDQVLACVAAAIDDLGLAEGLDRVKAFKDAPLHPCFAAESYRHSEDDQDHLLGTAADWRPALDNSGTWPWASGTEPTGKFPGLSHPAEAGLVVTIPQRGTYVLPEPDRGQ